LGKQLEISEKHLQAVEEQFPELALLRSIPGIGPLLALVIWSEIGDIERFASAKALANNTGLVASFYDSGTWWCRVASPARDRAGYAGRWSPPPTSPFSTATLSPIVIIACAARRNRTWPRRPSRIRWGAVCMEF
jgi:hypothetical protein